MKKITKPIVLVLILVCNSFLLPAQWCTVTTAIPYSTDMPGITHVVINTIDRISLPIEDYPNNSYVNTGMSTTLNAGQTYTISITHTRDAVIFPTVRNNIRVWIDYNHDYSFDDPGETVVSLNYQTYGTSTASFTVPMSFTPGMTRMRVTAKMSDDGGHTLPTSCDNPPDPLGYHGEVEDYDVILSSSVGINDLTSAISNFVIYPNPASTDLTVDFGLAKASTISLNIYDVLGKRIYWVSSSHPSGKHSLKINLPAVGITQKGIYFIDINDGKKSSVTRFAVL